MTDLTDIKLVQLNMAVGLSQTLVNEIISLSPPAPVAISFNYDESFNVAPPDSAFYSFSGTLDLSQTPAPIDCGGTVGSGIVCSLPLANGTAKVNGTAYSASTPWLFQVILDAFQLEVQPTSVSSQTQTQQSFMQQTYNQTFNTAQYGLDFSELAFMPSQPAPSGWAASDWTGFCTALQHYLISNPLTYKLPLMDAVIPQSDTLWNGGPTAWCCFNVPPYDNTCQGAVIFGYMVQGNPLPQSYQNDFISVLLFTGSSNNAFLLLSNSIVQQQFLQNLLPQTYLQQAAEVALVPNAENVVFSIIPGAMTATESSQSFPGLLWAYSGQVSLPSSYGLPHYFISEEADTEAGSTLFMTALTDSYYQQVGAEGSYTISGTSNGNQWGYQWTMPLTFFIWSIAAVMNVSSTGMVSFSVLPNSASFPNAPDPSNPAQVQGWWATFGSHSDLKTAQNWGNAAAGLIQNNFCVAGPNGQFNLFAFPGGTLYTFASAGLNQQATLVLLLTYKL
jgi:hypothetical protein